MDGIPWQNAALCDKSGGSIQGQRDSMTYICLSVYFGTWFIRVHWNDSFSGNFFLSQKEALISLLEIVLFMQQILPLKLLEITSYVTWTDGVGPFFWCVNSCYNLSRLWSFISSFAAQRKRWKSLNMQLIYACIGVLTPATRPSLKSNNNNNA